MNFTLQTQKLECVLYLSLLTEWFQNRFLGLKLSQKLISEKKRKIDVCIENFNIIAFFNMKKAV